MNFAQGNESSSRMTGFGIVVLIHVVIVYGLASGLALKAVEAVMPIETKVIEEKVKPPPPPEKVAPPPPDMKAPPPPFIPPPEVQVTAPPPPTPAISVQSSTPPPTREVAKAAPPAPPAPPAAPKHAPNSAAGSCTKMGKMESPAMNWSGRAEYVATFAVKAGRVSSVEIQVVRSPNDRKAQRAMTSAITALLQETYECPGDHAALSQEFVFNID